MERIIYILNTSITTVCSNFSRNKLTFSFLRYSYQHDFICNERSITEWPLVVTLFHSLLFVFICCHLLSLFVPLVLIRTNCYLLLSLVVPLVVICCHSIYHSFSFFVICCHSWCHYSVLL